MNGFKPFRASDHIKNGDAEVQDKKYTNNHEAITAVLKEYPNGQLNYGHMTFGCAGNSFVIEKNVRDAVVDVDLMNETIQHINSILEPFGLRSKKEANHYVDTPVKYFIVKIKDA